MATENTSHFSASTLGETHEVFNQPAPLENYNAYDSDVALQHWMRAFNGDFAQDEVRQYGQHVGHELIEAGFLANQFKPEFHSHDRFGHRIDLVKFHPAYHQLMRTAIEAGLHSLPWTTDRFAENSLNSNAKGAHVARAAMEYMHNQADSGSGCPLTMTFAAVPAIKTTPGLAKDWLPRITARHYDERNIPWFEKQGVTIGMAMTEKQGGSDVRANTTSAQPIEANKTGPGEAYQLVGHKWFCSAPMCDAFLVLAKTEQGLSCFLLPRWRPDGSKNQLYVQRLKNKMGNISNASAEVEFRGAYAQMVGQEGRGVATIIEMVSMTRFDCMVGSSALMRAATAQALHHTGGRNVFGKNLHQQVLMQNVLADLAIESEAALAMSMRVGNALDNPADEQQHLFARVATAIGKYWICKRAPNHAYEAMECLGGVGYVEENIMPRIYREAPVNAIWEGSGNVQCLDVLRAMKKESKVIDAFLAELASASGLDNRFDKFLNNLKDDFVDVSTLEYRSRAIVEKLALGLQASVLLKNGNQFVAEGFIASRISGSLGLHESGLNYGTLPNGVDCKAIIERAQPQL
ncbi:acyl-CoA dehydrogenase family protein [Oceanicoccus sp. KOV_DT_Chl]|uniref:acyl-CoA dehydrogenase family protein n=1 Tax=Oceanicoccus sp. KOV_DT_Chl TaxID=1904639 RepID=UPI000C7A707E|nr:acyl-CoA dehydrogenase family protein [Oceanicoccus sp. KOV_DT_Chl]